MADVNQAASRIGQWRIVKPGKGEIELFKALPDVGTGIGIGNTRSEISPVEFTDGFPGSFQRIP